MATLSLVIRTHKRKSDNTVPIYIRVLEKEKARFISTGCFILETDWDANSQQVKSKKNKDHIIVNAIINKKKSELENQILTIRATTDGDSKIIDNLAKQDKRRIYSNFFALSEKYFSKLSDTHKYNQLSAEKPRVNHLMTFNKNKNLTFDQIDVSFLKRFIVFLKTEYDCSPRTVMNHLIVIRTIYNYGIKEGIAEKNNYPFGKNGISIKFPESVKVGLNENEVTELENLDISQFPSLQYAKDVWLFAFYLAGIRISDVFKIKWKDCIDDRLTYKMGKNDKVVSLKLPTKASAILNRYRNNSALYNDYVFHELSGVDEKDYKTIYIRTINATKRINASLKIIADKTNIQKKLTCHIARHTFGNITGDKISTQLLQKLYRHTDIKTTIGYQANFIHRDVDDALETILSF